MRFHLSPKSSNAKTGEIAVTTSSADTCPSICPFKGHGCYAGTGPLYLHWRKVSDPKEARGSEWRDHVRELNKLPAGQIIRLNQAGDLPGKDLEINEKRIKDLIKIAKNRLVFTYTHKPVLTNKKNQRILKFANESGLTVNLSANSLKHADALYKLKIGPVVTVLPSTISGRQTKMFTPKGRRVIVCPASYLDTVSCKSCKLCATLDRDYIIGFPSHGCQKNKVNDVIGENV